MRKAEHLLRLSFDPEYQHIYAEFEEEKKTIMGLGISYYLKHPRKLSILPGFTICCVFMAIASLGTQYWWVGVIAGVVTTLSVPVIASVSLVEEERRKRGLDRVWPW
jgi:hypothetical protein